MTSDKGKTIENYVILDKMFVKQDKCKPFLIQLNSSPHSIEF